MRETTLCYIENDGRYLMLHRSPKKKDGSVGKWMGVGGKIEPGETPDECIVREVREETGLIMTDYRKRGVVHFYSDIWEEEIMHLYSCYGYEGSLNDNCDEGELKWIAIDKVMELNMWEGDRIFLKMMAEGRNDIDIELHYEGDRLVDKKAVRHICLGLLAHVDAGKTTLAEGLLYLSGKIKKPGRVDHKDAYLDTNDIERERGITIFSKQAQLNMGSLAVTLVDTPGHVDFAAEMERTLQILDYAVLVISGSEGVQSHVHTLWRLLNIYNIPVFIFVNKMDMDGTDRDSLMSELREELDDGCICFDEEGYNDEFYEEIAMRDEKVLDSYLEKGSIDDCVIAELIKNRILYPVCFGSALNITGVEHLMSVIERYATGKQYGNEFAARVYKITRDAQGNRLTHMKITGGSLVPRQVIDGEKVNRISICSGDRYEDVRSVSAGELCVVTGLTTTRAGGVLGAEEELMQPVLEPVLEYRLILPVGTNVHEVYRTLMKFGEEEPELHIVWDEEINEIHIKVMGDIQIEVLKRLIRERFDIEAEFGEGSIVYKETITEPVMGVGHYEPLRHYAEVQIMLSPGERGSGIQYDNVCSTDKLALNWQRLIMTHLEEKAHRGVLIGAEITDIKITLLAGKAHLKHTEGGDFRQASYRAVRHGLMKAPSVILEPYYEYELTVPVECTGRAMTDIQNMSGTCELAQSSENSSVITGRVPVAGMRGYQKEVASYTKGAGRLNCIVSGYDVCHDQEKVMNRYNYDPVGDIANPPGSVFCSHGAGYYVNWEQVEEYMHLEPATDLMSHNSGEDGGVSACDIGNAVPVRRGMSSYTDPIAPQAMSLHGLADKELEDIFVKTYGEITHKRDNNQGRTIDYDELPENKGPAGGDPKYARKKNAGNQSKENYLLVDGYNIIHAWPELRTLAEVNLESARTKLMDILCNYQGYRQMTLILVFDAYRVKGGRGSVMKYNNIHVVYTKEAETADQYIEKTVHKIAGDNNVTVATSDGLEQVIIFGQGAVRMSAMNLLAEVNAVNKEIGEYTS